MKIEVIEVRPSSAKRDCENVWVRVGINEAGDDTVSDRHLVIRGLPEWGTRMRGKAGEEFTLRRVSLGDDDEVMFSDGMRLRRADSCTPIDPDEELVEAMARAMYEEDYEGGWDTAQNPFQVVYRKRARAALKVIRDREATDE